MSEKTKDMDLSTAQRIKLKKTIRELETYRGMHTELVTVYIPSGYDLNKIMTHLQQEQGTATNIKSSTTRKNVIDALERMIQHLKLFKRTPENGLAVFSGNISDKPGDSDVRVWAIEPPVPLNTRIYRCDKTFVLEPLKDMVETRSVYGLVVLDRRDADISLLKGSAVIPLLHTHSEVPGKFKAGGQCLIKDTIVQLSDGLLPNIDIVHNPHKVKSVMIKNNFSIKDSNITDKWNTKKSKVYKITTKSPRLQIESSKDHVFFVVTNNGIIEKTAEDLNKDDYLIMPEKINVKGKIQKLNSKVYHNSFSILKEGRNLLKNKRQKLGLLQKDLANKTKLTQTTISSYELGKLNANKESLKKICDALKLNFNSFIKNYTDIFHHQNSKIRLPSKLNKDFAQFLGYYLGDGSSETDRISLIEQDKQVANAYKKKYDVFFNITSSYRLRESKNYYQLRFTSRPLVRFIKEEFPEFKKALDSTIPSKILLSPDDVVAGFLKGLFDAEGYVHNKRGIALGINNKRLAQQLQLVLLRFSILSSLHEYDNRANKYSDNPRFTIDITEKTSLKLFEKHIGFTSKSKTSKLKNIIKIKSNKSNVRQIICFGSKIRAIIESNGENLQQFSKVSSFFRDKRMMSKEIFYNSIIKFTKNNKLRSDLLKIYNYSILPVKINDIKVTNKITPMSDISVKDQNFIANGVLVHNSAQRFARQRANALKDHYKKIADYMKDQFLMMDNLKGIIIGGPSTTVSNFLNKDYITGDVEKKIIGTFDLAYTGSFGIQELVNKAKDLLAKEELIEQKQAMDKLLTLLARNPDKVSYGMHDSTEKLHMGAVETLLVHESLAEEQLDEFEELAQTSGAEIIVVAKDTSEGKQLEALGKIAGILRYAV